VVAVDRPPPDHAHAVGLGEREGLLRVFEVEELAGDVVLAGDTPD